MTKIRSDHKTDRNTNIYQEYLKSDASYEELANKYGITKQRVMFIINDIKTKGLGEILLPSDQKEEREKFKKLAVELREQGKIKLALEMFEQIITWDIENNNIRGQIDVLGHKKVCLTLLADNEISTKEKIKLLEKAIICIEDGIKLGKKSEVPKGTLAIQKVHLGTLYLKLSEIGSNAKKKKNCEIGKNYLEEALRDLPGSEAHKAWPMRALALSYYGLGEKDKALKTLNEAQDRLSAGYQEELNAGDQGRIKIKVWMSGIQLAYAEIMLCEKKYLLAEIYASSVIGIPDPDSILTARKKEAKEILTKAKDNNINSNKDK